MIATHSLNRSLFKFIGTISVFCVGLFTTNAQDLEDDTTLIIQRFTYDDLNTERFAKYKKESSTNRLAENPDDLVNEVIIIDGDDIRKFGYNTLVDVLKNIPGFRTSQPGSAVDGETFLMRGLVGNDHTKILINGIPIKPDAAPSFPIAAQLPIRHAEYIEIVQGPSSATYGSDAMAGVINIVFPEINRPVFAWADISGATPDVNYFNLTLGGKAGSGKNILNYEIFASSYKAKDVNLLIPVDSILVDTAGWTSAHWSIYHGESENNSIPEINELPRESRLIGTYMKFRWFELTAMNMYREDHSGFGRKPIYASYHDPNKTIGENINTVALKHNYSNYRNFSTRTSLSVVTYRTNTKSSYLSIADSLSNGENFIFGRSLDIRGEFQGIYTFNKLFKMAFGLNGMYGISNPYTDHIGRPILLDDQHFTLTDADAHPLTPAGLSSDISSISSIDSSTWIPTRKIFNAAGFTHFLYKSDGGKLNIELATRLDNNKEIGWRFTPKIGAVYRPNDRLKFVLFYSRGHRAPRSYYRYSNYWANAQDFGAGGRLNRKADSMRIESLQGGEFRFEYKLTNQLTLNGRYYAHLMENRVIRQVLHPPPPMNPPDTSLRVGYGYFNTESNSFLNAAMITLNYRAKINRVELNFLIGYEFANGWEEIEKEDNVISSIERSSEYRFIPEHSIKANLILEFKGFTFSAYNNFFGHYITDIYRDNSDLIYEETENYFYNLDLLIHKTLFRQLAVFLGAYNILNSVQSGIPTSTVSNSWDFNPQYGRVFKLGLNFRLN